MKHIYSQKGIFGEINHYDESGYVGYSIPNVIDGMDHYKSDGSYLGYSQEGLFGQVNHYDSDGYAGFSVPGVIGGEYHNIEGETGFSVPNVIDGFDTYWE